MSICMACRRLQSAELTAQQLEWVRALAPTPETSSSVGAFADAEVFSRDPCA